MVDYTTLSAVKAHLDIAAADTTFDTLLARLIGAASRQIDAYCGRTLAQAEYAHVLDGSGTRTLFTPESPIVALAAAEVDGVALPPADVAVYPEFLRTTDGAVWTRGIRNVSVTYTAGFYDAASENPPADVEDACVQLVAFKFNQRGREGIVSERVAANQDTLEPVAIPRTVAALLAPYRRPRVGL